MFDLFKSSEEKPLHSLPENTLLAILRTEKSPFLKGVKIKNISFTSAELLAQVEVNNPNDFNIAVKNFDYQLNVNQKQWGQGKVTESTNIPKKGKGIINIPLKLNLLSMGSAATALLKKSAPLEYQLKGNATLDTGLELLKNVSLPIDINGTTSMN